MNVYGKEIKLSSSSEVKRVVSDINDPDVNGG